MACHWFRLIPYYEVSFRFCLSLSTTKTTNSCSRRLRNHRATWSLPTHESVVFRCMTSYRSMKTSSCPFQVLGFSRQDPSVTYAKVKKTFLKIAMQNHPDVLHQQWNQTSTNQLSEAEKEKQKKKCVEYFMKARQAFEDIVELEDGTCALRSEMKEGEDARTRTGPNKMSAEEFDEWFLHETGHNNPYQFDLDPATMREVAEMTEKLGDFGGGERDGGMWTLARMISSTVQMGGGKDPAGSILRLEAGVSNQQGHEHSYYDGNAGGEYLKVNGQLRRRRIRRRRE